MTTDALHPFPAIDPDRNVLIFCVGRKGSGKSVAARELFRAWPYVDKLVIDPTGDADPGDMPPPFKPTKTYRGPLPTQLATPTRLDGSRASDEFTVTRWVADPASPTYQDDLDRSLGLALFPQERRVLIWIDEAGEVFPAGRTGPNGRTLLKQSRHWYVSAIMCDPRPVNVDPLVLAQADIVLIFDVPNPNDRVRLASCIGVPPKVLADELDQLRARGEFWFLLYDARENSLYRCPPMPMSEGYAHAQQ